MTDTVKGNPMFPKTEEITPPDWVLLEAAKRSDWGDDDLELLSNEYAYRTCFAALCDMIERYEQPPVDRKLLCAREAGVQLVLERKGIVTADEIAIRAIELFEQGFGK